MMLMYASFAIWRHEDHTNEVRLASFFFPFFFSGVRLISRESPDYPETNTAKNYQGRPPPNSLLCSTSKLLVSAGHFFVLICPSTLLVL